MKKSKILLRSVALTLVCTFAVSLLSPIGTLGDNIAATASAAVSYKTVNEFAEEVEKIAGESVRKEGEYADKTKHITYADAAVLLNRADEVLNGTTYDVDLYKQIVDKKRLTGLTGLTAEQKKALRFCFMKGIIIGNSNGTYSQSRSVNAKGKLTASDATKYLTYLKNKGKRIKLSPDGQVIRTTNLPKNYKKFPYILASFPNSFYESKFIYQYSTGKLVNKKDYWDPADVRKSPFRSAGPDATTDEVFKLYLDKWCKKVETNLKTRLSFNYKTCDNEWINSLRGTYKVSNDAAADKPRTNEIKNYVKTATKNKVILKCAKVVVEPSSAYTLNGLVYVRAYVKFKLVSADKMYTEKSMKQNEIIYGEYIGLENWKKGVWYTGCFDLSLGGTYGGDDGRDWSIFQDFMYKEK